MIVIGKRTKDRKKSWTSALERLISANQLSHLSVAEGGLKNRKRQPWDSSYRQAWNALVQGTGSDCTSRAFYLTDVALRNRKIGRALFTVHDEILIEVKKEFAEEGEKILIENMKLVGKEIRLTVELKAEGSGPMVRWED